MKLTLPLKNFSAIIFVIACCVHKYQSEPFVSRSSITPVKLVKGNHRNRSALYKRDELQLQPGSVAKISRVVPSKRLTKQSPNNVSKSESASNVLRTEKLVANHYEKVDKVVTPPTIGTWLVPKGKKQKQLSSSTTTTKGPLVLSANSWDYLNSVVTDDELRKVISGLPEDVVNNATNITRRDPVAGQNYLFNSILDQLSSLKFPRSRMLEGEAEKKVNTGVRYSAKRKPVLNVMPSPQLNKIGSIQNTTKKEIDQRVVSGHITNTDSKISSKYSSTLEKPGIEEDGNADDKKSTTPSIMNVIAVPNNNRDPYSTTPLSPSISSDYETGFVPVFPINYSSTTAYNPSVNQTDGKTKLTSVRKPRGPPREGNYLLPAITSSLGPETVNKGYQTIPESTTPGTKVVWYSHNQTPEDTFFPNSDGYLVPPEESSLEFLTDLALLTIPNGSSENQTPSSLDIKKDDSKTSPSVMMGLMKENGSGGGGVTVHPRSNQVTRFPKNSKKTSKSYPHHLQTAATDHDVIHYNEDSKNGGGRRGRNGYRFDDDGKQHFSSSFKSHEVPPYQEINGNHEDDIVSHGAYNEIDHYHHDSFPNKHEISQYHGSGNSRPQDGYNGNYPLRDNGPNSGLDGDYGRRPEKPKQSSPGQGYGHGNNHYGHHGHGHHGWKEPSKDFFDLAKDYFKNSDLSTTQKWFDVTIGVLAFLAFGGYIIMLLYQVFTVGSGTQLGMLVGRSFRGAGEVFDTFFSKGPIGQAYMDEIETIVKRAMANVKRIWTTNSIKPWETPKVKGEVDVDKE